MSDKQKRRYSSDSDSDDYIKWKISKLKKRLTTKARMRGQEYLQPSPSTSNQHSSHQADVISPDVSDDDDIPLSIIAGSDTGTIDPIINNPAVEENSTLDASILALLGDEQPSPDLLGPKIHGDLATRWSLLKKYPPAENCTLLKGPRINPEVASVINDQVARRDSNLINLQDQIGAALSALGQLRTALILEEGGAKHSYIELASDTSRLLLDFHHKYSVIRRDLLVLNLRKDLKETLTNVSADGWLFGKNLGERIKATKDIEKAGLDLKPGKTLKSHNSFKQPSKQDPLNLNRPPRPVQKGISRSGRQNKNLIPSQIFQQRRYTSQRKTTEQDRRRRQEVRFNYKRSQ